MYDWKQTLGVRDQNEVLLKFNQIVLKVTDKYVPKK